MGPGVAAGFAIVPGMIMGGLVGAASGIGLMYVAEQEKAEKAATTQAPAETKKH
jgi:hypothetical protein